MENRLFWGKGGSRETSQLATALIQTQYAGGLDRGGTGGGGKKWSTSGLVLKVKQMGFADEVVVGVNE